MPQNHNLCGIVLPRGSRIGRGRALTGRTGKLRKVAHLQCEIDPDQRGDYFGRPSQEYCQAKDKV